MLNYGSAKTSDTQHLEQMRPSEEFHWLSVLLESGVSKDRLTRQCSIKREEAKNLKAKSKGLENTSSCLAELNHLLRYGGGQQILRLLWMSDICITSTKMH